jgi:hypothetical protein
VTVDSHTERDGDAGADAAQRPGRAAGTRWQTLVQWMLPIVVTSIIFGTIYVVTQQLDRLSANDDPLRLASQVAAELREGQTTTVNSQPHVDLERSLALFVVVENSQGSPTSGSGFLKNQLVSLPTGVLSNAAQTGRDDVTWEPEHGLRFATVTLKVGDQFVSAGQSLAPSEDRDNTFRQLIGFGWLASMIVICGSLYWLRRVRAGVLRQSVERSPAPHSSE